MIDSMLARIRGIYIRMILAAKSLSPKERLAFVIFLCGFLIASLGIIWKIHQRFLVEIPAPGGEMAEGIIGIPRFVNPLLATSDVDRDLATLVFSGLVKINKNGEPEPDLAESYAISEDGLIYTFTLREKLYWHDGKPLTADDIEFTLKKAQDPALKSPRRAALEGVSVEKVGSRVIRLTLKSPYAPFLENATLGIIPKHIWNNISNEAFALSDYNLSAIGSGPYRISDIGESDAGIPLFYEFAAFSKFHFGRPYISNIIVRFYPNKESLETAYRQGIVESIASLSPDTVANLKKRNSRIEKSVAPLPRIFAIFFNQNQKTILAESAVRRALERALPRGDIVVSIFGDYAIPINGPIPPGAFGYIKDDITNNISATTSDRIKEVKDILTAGGWKWNSAKSIFEKTVPAAAQKKSKTAKQKRETVELAFTLATSDIDELKKVAASVIDAWKRAGINVELKTLEVGDLNQNIIRPRKYDALLFGEIVGRSSDIFSFWHSSQRNDPGLNVALYTNTKVDKLIEVTRTSHNKEERIKNYGAFQKEIAKDNPAVFLYAPYFLYVLPAKIRGVTLESIMIPSDRFANINTWYIETDKVWKIFARK